MTVESAVGVIPLDAPGLREAVSRKQVRHGMTRLSAKSAAQRPSTTVRVFADEVGRLWSAAATGGVLVFNCATETRQAARAIAVELATLDDSITDDALRAWLEQAPRIGTLL